MNSRYLVKDVTDRSGKVKLGPIGIGDVVLLTGFVVDEQQDLFVINRLGQKCHMPMHTSTVESLTRKNNYVIMTTRNSIYHLQEV